jgi:hypothetical protein
MPPGKGKGFLCPLLNRLILPAVRQFRKAVIFPRPMQAEDCNHNDEQKKDREASPFLTSFHLSLSFEVAVITAMVMHSNRISA